VKAELGIHSTDIRVGGMAYAWCPASHNARNLHNVRSAAAVLRSYVKNNILSYVLLSSARAVVIETNPIATDLTYTAGQ